MCRDLLGEVPGNINGRSGSRESLQNVDLRCGCWRLSISHAPHTALSEGQLQEHHKPLVQGTGMKETDPCPCEVHNLEGETTVSL